MTCLKQGEHIKLGYHVVIYHVAIISATCISVPEVCWGHKTVSFEINIKLWPSSINPFVRPSNSSPERKAVVRRAGAGSRMGERERDVWRELDWWMGKLLHRWEDVSFIASCLSLPLPLVSFMAVITERMHGQTALPKIPISHIKHMHTDTHKLNFNLSQQAELPSGQCRTWCR